MNNIFSRISSDLNIKKLSIETEEQFYSRLVYSSLSFWIKTSAYSIFGENISKKSILVATSPFLKTILEIYPNIYNWFYYDESRVFNPIVELRNRLYNSGELANVDFDSNLVLSNFQKIECETLEIYRGNIEIINNYISGLVSYKGIGTLSEIDIAKLFDFYFINHDKAHNILKKKLENLNWTKENKKDSEIFNPYLKEPLSKGFSKDYKLQNGEISLYKENFSDYGFIKNTNGEYYISHLSNFEIREKEIRRFQYALKNTVNNSQIAKYNLLVEDRVVILNLYSALPKKEENIMFLFGWPINNISDSFNFIFNLSVWNLIKKMLENLDILLIEEA